MSSNILRSKSLLREIGGGVLLSLGGAATWAVFNFLRGKSESRHGLRSKSQNASRSNSPTPETIAPIESAIVNAPVNAGASRPADDLALRIQKAMDAEPSSLGYEKAAWTAPLLANHLRKEYAMAVPLSRIKVVLKDLDYHWKGFHYEKKTGGKPRKAGIKP